MAENVGLDAPNLVFVQAEEKDRLVVLSRRRVLALHSSTPLAMRIIILLCGPQLFL